MGKEGQKGKFGAWLKGKLKGAIKHNESINSTAHNRPLQQAQQPRGPLTGGLDGQKQQHARSSRTKTTKQQAGAAPGLVLSEHSVDDDCSQARVSSDQLSFVEVATQQQGSRYVFFPAAPKATQQGQHVLMPPPCCRFDDHGQSRQLPERACDGSDGSSPDSTQATTQMAALRELLVAHISKLHLQPHQPLLSHHVSTKPSAVHAWPECSPVLQTAWSDPGAAATTQPAAFGMLVNPTADNDNGSSMPGAARAPPAAAGLTAKQALAADHMQLLEMVEFLISDHQTSLLERKHLQQQLESAQQALHGEALAEQERAAARADVRWGPCC